MNSIIRYIIALTFISLSIFFCWYFKSIIVYILISVVLSFIGKPLINTLDKIKIKKHHIPQSLKAFITLVTIWLILFSFFRLMIPLLSTEAQLLSKIDISQAIIQLEEPISKIDNFSKHLSSESNFDIKTYLIEKITSVLQISQLKTIFGSIATTIGDIIIAMFSVSFITFFFLKDSKLFQKMILVLLPDKYEDSVRNALQSIQKLLVRYFVGISIEVILVMLLNIIGHSLFVGLEFSHVVIISLFAGLMNVIPYIGPIIGTLFGLTIGLAVNINLDFYSEVLPILGYMTIVFMTVQLLDNIVFQPLIYGNSVHAHPLEIFIVILMAGNLAGIYGMILAIPSYTVLRVIAKEFFNKYPVINKITQNLDQAKN